MLYSASIISGYVLKASAVFSMLEWCNNRLREGVRMRHKMKPRALAAG